MAVFLAIDPVAHISGTVSVVHLAFAVSLVVRKLAFVISSIVPFENPEPAHLVFRPVTVVLAAVDPYVFA
jgi:hypothetical protein